MGPVEIKGLILALAVVSGTACIYMGYRLFMAGIDQPGTSQADGGVFRFVWTGYGPGVAFALFGAALIAFAVTRDLSADYERVTDPFGKTIERGRVAAASMPAEP